MLKILFFLCTEIFFFNEVARVPVFLWNLDCTSAFNAPPLLCATRVNWEKCKKKSCSRVQIVRPYRLHCPLEDMPLSQGMNQIFTFIDSVLFQRKQEVLLSLTHGKL